MTYIKLSLKHNCTNIPRRTLGVLVLCWHSFSGGVVMNRSLVIKFIKGFVYIVVTLVFMTVFIGLLSQLVLAGQRRFDYVGYIPIILFPLVMSIIFSWKHFLHLIKEPGKLEIRISNLAIAAILLLPLHFSFLIPNQLWFVFGNGDFGRPYGISIYYFMIFFNLIHAFRKRRSN